MFNVVKPMKIHGSSMNIHELVPYIGANYNDRTQFSRTLESWFILEESSQKGPTFQVREL
jgi:hypothetical protein